MVALSKTNAEYIATTYASKEVVWLQQLCLDIGFKQQDVRLGCDIQNAIFLAKNPTYHSN